MWTYARKATAAAVIAAAAAVTTALSDGTISANEWIGVVVAGIVGGATVFYVPNQSRNPVVRAVDDASDGMF